MKFIAIIPARFQSTRFPGKPLVLIHGKPMIQWVVEKTSTVIDEVWVATDHEGIARATTDFGGKAIMTSPDHPSGTDRCAEAARILSHSVDFDVVINVQGDEPFIRPEQILQLKSSFSPEVQIATLARKITTMDELLNPNKPKVVTGKNGHALYFSRSVIPFFRDIEQDKWLVQHNYLAHIGMYGYRKDILQEITQLEPGLLENAESLEQLRWLENGYTLKVVLTNWSSMGIDTPEDLHQALQLFENFLV